MSSQIVNLNNRIEDNFYNYKFKGIDLWEFLRNAIRLLFYKSYCSDGPSPDEWNPVVWLSVFGPFDPNMMDGGSAANYGLKGWSPWPDFNGIERTRWLLDKNSTTEKLNKAISQSYTNMYDIMYKLFAYVKETISENEVIINICNLRQKKFKRAYITDLKRFNDIVFDKELPLKVVELLPSDIEELKKIVIDGSEIEIKEQNAYEIMKRLGFLEHHVVPYSVVAEG